MGDYTRTLACASFVTLITLLTSCQSSRNISETISLRFSTTGRIPVIAAKINGKPAYFIVDTGASCSILNESMSQFFGFKVERGPGHLLIGLSGSAKMKIARDYVVEFARVPMRISFRAQNIDQLVNAIQENENMMIAGILGADALKQYGMQIDFNRYIISFERRAYRRAPVLPNGNEVTITQVPMY